MLTLVNFDQPLFWKASEIVECDTIAWQLSYLVGRCWDFDGWQWTQGDCGDISVKWQERLI